MDDTERALLAGVCAAPDDTTQRLVYADWLQENGQGERAEFIRVQVELATKYAHHAKNGHKHNNCPACVLDRRQRQLLKGNHYRWCVRLFATVPRLNEKPLQNNNARYRCGFVSDIACDADIFLRHAADLIWNPDQTTRCAGCPKCKSGMIYTGMDGMKWIECRVPRPCPPTAQPITRVVVTEPPSATDHGSYFVLDRDPEHQRIPGYVCDAVYPPDTIALILLRYRFPNIEFVASYATSSGSGEHVTLTPHTFAGAIRVPDELLPEYPIPADAWRSVRMERSTQEIDAGMPGKSISTYHMQLPRTVRITGRFRVPEGYRLGDYLGTVLTDVRVRVGGGSDWFLFPRVMIERVNGRHDGEVEVEGVGTEFTRSTE